MKTLRPLTDVRLWRDEYGRAHASVPHRHRHSSELNWGYGGSGPADLSFSILAHFYGEAFAEQYASDFKWDVIATIPISAREYTIPAETIAEFVARVTSDAEHTCCDDDVPF